MLITASSAAGHTTHSYINEQVAGFPAHQHSASRSIRFIEMLPIPADVDIRSDSSEGTMYASAYSSPRESHSASLIAISQSPAPEAPGPVSPDRLEDDLEFDPAQGPPSSNGSDRSNVEDHGPWEYPENHQHFGPFFAQASFRPDVQQAHWAHGGVNHRLL